MTRAKIDAIVENVLEAAEKECGGDDDTNGFFKVLQRLLLDEPALP